MGHDLDRCGGDWRISIRAMKQLLTASAVTVVLAGCALPADRAVRAYDACVARHPQDTVVCEGPRQAYEADTSTLQARAPDTRPAGWLVAVMESAFPRR
jgi:hypothetical protein